MKIKTIKSEIAVPDKIQVTCQNNLVSVKGDKGELKKVFPSKKVDIKLDSNKIVLEAKKCSKREKRMIGTFKAHIKNMLKGVTAKHLYQLKICSGHFPMNVSVSNSQFIVKNFLGEKIPRKIGILEGVNVKVDGETVTVEGVNLYSVSQCAASIEQLTRITNRDRRIFQDGIYITNKDGIVLK